MDLQMRTRDVPQNLRPEIVEPLAPRHQKNRADWRFVLGQQRPELVYEIGRFDDRLRQQTDANTETDQPHPLLETVGEPSDGMAKLVALPELLINGSSRGEMTNGSS